MTNYWFFMLHERRATKTRQKSDQIIWRWSDEHGGRATRRYVIIFSIYRKCFITFFNFIQFISIAFLFNANCCVLLPNPIALIFHDSASSHAFCCGNQLLINNSRLTVKRRKRKLLLSLGIRLIATGREKMAQFCRVKRKLACFKAISIVSISLSDYRLI